MSDPEEACIALRAALATGLPVIVSFVFDAGRNHDRTMTGATPERAAAAVAAEGADAVGANCGAGIEGFAAICRRLRAASGLPVWIKPNAGLPVVEAGAVAYPRRAGGICRARAGVDRGRRVFPGRLLRLLAGVYPGDARMRLKLISCEVLFREMCDAVARSPHQVDVEFLPKGLHDLGSAEMRGQLQAAVGPDRPRAVFGHPARLRPVRQRVERAARGPGAAGDSAGARLHRACCSAAGKSTASISMTNPGTYFRSTGWLERGQGLVQLAQQRTGIGANAGGVDRQVR